MPKAGHERSIGFLIEHYAGDFLLGLAPEQVRVHTMLVFGRRKLEAGVVSVRLHGKGPQGAKPWGEVVMQILAAIRERRAWRVRGQPVCETADLPCCAMLRAVASAEPPNPAAGWIDVAP